MSTQVHQMFSQVAPRYDLTNDVLSMGTHRLWRREAVRRAGVRAGDAVLDCATGTGDLALAFRRAVGPAGKVVGTDFNADMLAAAPGKAKAAGLDITFQVADVMALPFPDGAFDVSSISFGIRNVDSPVQALRELGRVLKPGGRAVVLEFGQPEGAFGAAFRVYARFGMPLIGQVLTGNRAAYEYLPRTAGAFPCGQKFLALMDESKAFTRREAYPLLGGLAWIYVGTVA